MSLNRSTGKAAVRRAVKARGVIAAMGAGAALAVALLLGGAGLAVAETHRDPKAVEIANAVEQAVAPGGGWEKVAALQFTFRVAKDGAVKADYRHLWDVRTGQYRVDWTEPDGSGRCVIFDLATKQGKAYRHLLPPVSRKPGGEEEPLPNPIVGWFTIHRDPRAKDDPGGLRALHQRHLLAADAAQDEGPGREPRLRRRGEAGRGDLRRGQADLRPRGPDARGHLLGLREPQDPPRGPLGVHPAGRGRDEGTPNAAQAAGGEKPKGAAGRGGRRQREATGSAPAAAAPPPAPERTAWTWTDWQSFGPLTLATTKSRVGGSAVIQFRNVEVLKEIPAGAFDPPK